MDYVACERCSFSKDQWIDEYRVDKVLGEGTFGCVYRVSTVGGQTFALKLLKLWEVLASERTSLMKRFDMEFETGKIPSNYLVHSYSKGMIKGNPYIVMEFCSGGDLPSGIRSSRLNLQTAATHVLYGLKDLHNCGKVHRDLKPENVLVREDGTAVLTDFGISGDRNHRMTQRGINGVPKQLFGTFGYMPPEQVNPRRGNATVLPTTDIFSFGVMMYELITGDLPFGRLQTQADLPMYIENGKKGNWDRDKLRRAKKGAEWEEMIEGCLIPDFKKRFQTVDIVLPYVPGGGGSQSLGYESVISEITKPQLDVINGVLLKVMQGEEAGKTYRLDELSGSARSLLTMGRQTDDIYNVIPIKEEDSCYISRCHCTFEPGPSGEWIVRDGQWRTDCPIGLGMHAVFPCTMCQTPCSTDRRHAEWKRSLNGTFVNSTEVDNMGMAIKPGDIVTIGNVKLRVEGY